MTEKVGRNDLCPCGSGKKYKSCCLQKQQSRGTTFGGRKFKAKVLSGGGVNKPQAPQDQAQAKGVVDYATLMERSFGESMHVYEEKPPVPANPTDYLVKDKPKE